MRKMVQGTEHEYTLYCRKMGTMGFDPHMMALDLLRESDLHLAGQFIRDLVPHLATRIIYTGAGDIVRGKYVLSPMAFLTSQVISGETMHDTGILNTRDEPHADGRLWRRLHVIVGDALMNETAIMLRHFVTSGVLQLMEAEALDDVPRMKDPIRDLWHNVEIRNPEQWKVELEDGRVVSPIDIQRYYLEKIEAIVEDDWEHRALRMFEEVLDDLANRRSKDAARHVEWLDRYYAIQEAADKKGGPDVEMMACKQYSEIAAERSLFYKRQRAGLVDRITDDEAIKRAIHEPPEDSRALLRRTLCDTFNIEMIDWSVLIVNDGTRRRIDLLDPYATKLEAPYATAS